MPMLVLLVGLTILVAIGVKALMERARAPALVGFILIGFAIRLLDTRLPIQGREMELIYDFLANVGVFCLLFKVGLESNVAGLVGQLRRASVLWVGDVTVSWLSGFLVSHYLLSIQLIPSLFIATALTVTSVGVSAGAWQEEGAINSPNGELLLDLAEMDDISGVVLMTFLFALAPTIQRGGGAILPFLGKLSGIFFLKFAAFAVFCALFSLYLEHPLTKLFKRLEPPPDSMIMIAGTGLVIAAIAGLLDFSVAIGAFFAGLMFSRDPEAVKLESSFESLYDMFTPFFFIGIGLGVDPGAVTHGLILGVGLTVLAFAGKVGGVGLFAGMTMGWSESALLGLSMVPRAEIALLIMQQGQKLGVWAVPQRVFAGMVVVSGLTCILSPLIIRPMLARRPRGIDGRG